MATYFAYGSNLNATDLNRWCKDNDHPYPLGDCLGTAWLPDHSLAFNVYSWSRKGGACNIVPSLGQMVPGAIFEVPDDRTGVLDSKEGVPATYQKVEAVALKRDGGIVACFTYKAEKPEEYHHPSSDYLGVVLGGLKSHRLPIEHVLAAADNRQPLPFVTHFFCYGTLMRGEGLNASLMATGAQFVREARVSGTLINTGGYPGLLPNAHGNTVLGELYIIVHPEKMLKRLDMVEGFHGHGRSDNLFHRILVEADTPDGNCLAWAYSWANETAFPRIESGDWRNK